LGKRGVGDRSLVSWPTYASFCWADSSHSVGPTLVSNSPQAWFA
jgi:hypothetical protein